MNNAAQAKQESYYKNTAEEYDAMHLNNAVDGEHYNALYYMSACITQYNIKSILDVGAGTGRTLKFLKNAHPNLRVVGIEPVEALREVGYRNGLAKDELISGDGTHIQFEDASFDLVCEFGILHHVPKPNLVVAEMLRVAKRSIFISDSNNFGQGSYLARSIKQAINYIGLWPMYNYVITKGKMYHYSEGDGVFYSYSVFNNLKQLKASTTKIYFLNTQPTGYNLFKSASSIALHAVK